jgi:acyl-coenzyme A thioesterase PaaI-like protein
MPSTWAGGDFQQPPRTDGGVALCGACRRIDHCRLGLTEERLGDDGIARFALVCPEGHEGGPGVAHGAWIAGIFDEVLGHVPILHDQMTVTGELTVRFIKPVPIERPLEARAWADKVNGPKWQLQGELVLASSGALLAKAQGTFVARNGAAHFRAFQEWLAQQRSI